MLSTVPACSTPIQGIDSGMLDGGSDAPDARSRDAPFDACAASISTAVPLIAPVDIVWVVDTSGSMDDERDLVQSNLNTFTSAIAVAELDYHVVVIADAGGITIPPPLGDDTTRFRYVAYNVGSIDLMQGAVTRHPMYADFLRPDASIHFVFVTDDESNMPASTFLADMEALVGDFTVHAIASPSGSTHCTSPGVGCGTPGCEGLNGAAQDNGVEYALAAATTGGLFVSICEDDWTMLFARLSEAVSIPQPLPCRFEIPEPPTGGTLDPDLVTLTYTPSGGGSPVPFARSTDDCASGFGWQYDDDGAPTRIDLCARDCATVRDDEGATLQIDLGCGS